MIDYIIGALAVASVVLLIVSRVRAARKGCGCGGCSGKSCSSYPHGGCKAGRPDVKQADDVIRESDERIGSSERKA